MFAYWLLFSAFALGAITERPFAHWQNDRRDPLLVLAMVLLATLIGLRYQVGGDWGAYLRQFVYAFAELLSDRLTRPLIERAMTGSPDSYDL